MFVDSLSALVFGKRNNEIAEDFNKCKCGCKCRAGRSEPSQVSVLFSLPGRERSRPAAFHKGNVENEGMCHDLKK